MRLTPSHRSSLHLDVPPILFVTPVVAEVIMHRNALNEDEIFYQETYNVVSRHTMPNTAIHQPVTHQFRRKNLIMHYHPLIIDHRPQTPLTIQWITNYRQIQQSVKLII